MAEQTKTAVAPAFKSALVKQQDVYMNMVTSSMKDYQLDLSNEDRGNVLAAIGKINELLTSNGMTFKDVDQSNLGQILTTVAVLKLNPNAQPSEIYFQLRNKKIGNEFTKVIEMGIQGAGNDAILRHYGVDVKSVMNPFIVHEGDELTLPYFDGEKMVGFTWKPKSYHGKVTAVVYVINKTDGTREYAIADRESVADNLRAHISNNLMAVAEETKNPILEKIMNMSLDEMLNDASLKGSLPTTYGKTVKIISPAWLGSQREAMIERKMRNNAIKKYPKNFSNSLQSNGYESTYEDYDQYRTQAKKEVNPLDVVEAEYDNAVSNDNESKALETHFITGKENCSSEDKTPLKTAENNENDVDLPF
jgi:hypothetical protein